MDISIIADHTFDLWSKELAELMKIDEAEQSVYYQEFKSFDGSSGYDLPYSMPDIQATGLRMLEHHRRVQKDKMVSLMERRGIQ